MQQFTMSVSSLWQLLAIKTLPMLQEVLHPLISCSALSQDVRVRMLLAKASRKSPPKSNSAQPWLRGLS